MLRAMSSLDLLNWGAETPATTEMVPTSSTLPTPWPARLAFDIALGLEDQEDLRRAYQLTENEFLTILSTPAFRREVAAHATDVRENGVTFKAKAKLQAEEYLTNLHDIVTDPNNAASVRLDAIKSVVKWAGYEPKDTGKEAPAVPSFNIQINL